MEWAQIPVMQLGAFGVLLGVVWLVGWLVFKGHLVPSSLVPRSTLDDVRADRDERIAQAEKDRDERIAEAEKDAERGWKLYDKEQTSHALTRRALLDQALGVTAPALALTETAEKILTEFQDSGSADG